MEQSVSSGGPRGPAQHLYQLIQGRSTWRCLHSYSLHEFNCLSWFPSIGECHSGRRVQAALLLLYMLCPTWSMSLLFRSLPTAFHVCICRKVPDQSHTAKINSLPMSEFPLWIKWSWQKYVPCTRHNVDKYDLSGVPTKCFHITPIPSKWSYIKYIYNASSLGGDDKAAFIAENVFIQSSRLHTTRPSKSSSSCCGSHAERWQVVAHYAIVHQKESQMSPSSLCHRHTCEELRGK